MGPDLIQQCREAVHTCDVARATLNPLLFRHKTDFSELQIGLLALNKAVAALNDVIAEADEGGEP